MSAGLGRGRSDVPPTAWELPLVVVATWLTVASLLLPAGRGAASWAFGGGWVWPSDGHALLASVGGLATGHTTAGLTAAQAAAVPIGGHTYAAIAVAELLLLAATVFAVRIWWHALGPGSMRGMASRADVESVLGLTRLRKAGPIIRPDLYSTSRRSRRLALPPGTSGDPWMSATDPAREHLS